MFLYLLVGVILELLELLQHQLGLQILKDNLMLGILDLLFQPEHLLILGEGAQLLTPKFLSC